MHWHPSDFLNSERSFTNWINQIQQIYLIKIIKTEQKGEPSKVILTVCLFIFYCYLCYSSFKTSFSKLRNHRWLLGSLIQVDGWIISNSFDEWEVNLKRVLSVLQVNRNNSFSLRNSTVLRCRCYLITECVHENKKVTQKVPKLKRNYFLQLECKINNWKLSFEFRLNFGICKDSVIWMLKLILILQIDWCWNGLKVDKKWAATWWQIDLAARKRLTINKQGIIIGGE